MKNLILLLSCILFPLIVGSAGGFFTSIGVTSWYIDIKKPSFNPPNYVFGPVWTILYILMGISFYLVVKSLKFHWSMFLTFLVQLGLNFSWSLIFFYLHDIKLAFIEIILLWISILFMILLFYKANKWAAFINIPYLLWVSFATVLNYYLYLLN